MKIITVIFTVVSGLAMIAVLTGLYPIAIVGKTPIFQKKWQKVESAAQRFSDAQARAKGTQPIDFSSADNREILLEVKRGTLTFLVEDAIISEKGEEVIDGLGALSRERVLEALRTGNDPAGAAKAVYGLDLNDFRDLVLLPQARRDVLQEALVEKNQDLDTWLRSAKSMVKVRLFFVPFSWDGETIK